jgi:hypothetical protein
LWRELQRLDHSPRPHQAWTKERLEAWEEFAEQSDLSISVGNVPGPYRLPVPLAEDPDEDGVQVIA